MEAHKGKILFAVLAAFIAMQGCYGNKPHQRSVYEFSSVRSKARMVVVEADDHGGFWTSGQPQAALAAVRQSVAAGPTAVVIFVHGWGHNAATKDQNQVCFTRTLDYLSERLNTGEQGEAVRAEQAKTLSRMPDRKEFNVVGIYVGWRGKGFPELPGKAFVLTRPWTFWVRKTAAERVGRGDLRIFIKQLGGIYDSAALRPLEEQLSSPFNLVGIGHSFGAQVLFPATASLIEAELQRAAGDAAWRALRNKPVTNSSESLVRGFGDLVVIVNPAMEASAYEQMKRLSAHLQFSRAQTPVLAVFSAQNDWPNKWMFPIGRFLSTTFQATSEAKQRAARTRALGRYTPQITHHLELKRRPVIHPPSSSAEKDIPDKNGSNPFAQKADGCDLPWSSPNDVDSLELAIKADSLNADPTAGWTINGKRIQPAGKDHQPYAPVMVVQSRSTEIIDNHNGFFTPDFVDFLLRYVGDIQLKRLKTTATRVRETTAQTR